MFNIEHQKYINTSNSFWNPEFNTEFEMNKPGSHGNRQLPLWVGERVPDLSIPILFLRIAPPPSSKKYMFTTSADDEEAGKMGKTFYLSDSERCLLCGLLRGEAPADLVADLRRVYGEKRDLGEITMAICLKLED